MNLVIYVILLYIIGIEWQQRYLCLYKFTFKTQVMNPTEAHSRKSNCKVKTRYKVLPYLLRQYTEKNPEKRVFFGQIFKSNLEQHSSYFSRLFQFAIKKLVF